MKFCAVRCCNFASSLKNPDQVLVYLLAAALGFETCENIEYAFGGGGAEGGAGVLLGELFVLVIRVCMPIHAICSVIQAERMCQVVDKKIRKFFVVLFSHFDFFVFFVGIICMQI